MQEYFNTPHLLDVSYPNSPEEITFIYLGVLNIRRALSLRLLKFTKDVAIDQANIDDEGDITAYYGQIIRDEDELECKGIARFRNDMYIVEG